MRWTPGRVAILSLFVLGFAGRYAPSGCRTSDDPVPLVCNLENVSPAELEKVTYKKLDSGVRVGSYALHAHGLQSFREWYKLTANAPKDIDSIVSRMIAENEQTYRTKFSYRKSDLRDSRIVPPGNNAPAWWDPGSIQSGYSLVSDALRSGAFLIDVPRQLVYFINSD